MPVPSNISDLSTTPADNSPQGTESPSTADDYLRTHAAFIATLNAANTAHVAAADPHAQYAPLASPALTGTPTAPTATAGTNTTQVATTAFVATAVSDVSIAYATETASGKIEIATSAEAAAGTDTARAITPAGLRSGLNASGSAPVFACRAWVNFNGTNTVAIRASGNVSSITDHGTGEYTVNFTTAMPDANYCVNVSTERSSGYVNVCSYANSSVRMYTYSTATLIDVTSAFASIFR